MNKYTLRIFNSEDCSCTKIKDSLMFVTMCEVEKFLVDLKYQKEKVYKNKDLEVYFNNQLLFTGTCKHFKRYLSNMEIDES